MSDSISIVEKPEWVSWDDIRQCLIDAHADNRARGINMAHYQYPADKIKESVGDNGTMLVALDGNKVVGTAAIEERNGKAWYVNGRYAYMCYAGVLPEYCGRGIYSDLLARREEIAKALDYDVLLFDTHSDNKAIQEITKKRGYRLVGFLRSASRDHFSVIMVKWLKGCPYSKAYCDVRFHISRIKTIVKSFLLP